MRDAVAGSVWGIEIGLQSQASPFLFKQNPTIASGDWKRSIVTAAGSIGALTNLDNLPTVSPSSSQSVSIILSASETTAAGAGGHINIWGIDAAGAEWSDVEIIVDVVAVSLYSAVPSAAAGASGGLPTVDSSNAVKVQSGTGANQISLTGGLVTLANGSLTSAKFATDAIDANALKADAVTEIQSGLGTTANQTTIINALATIASYIDTEVAAIKTKTDNLPDDPADASDIAAALAAITGYIDTEVATLIANVASILGQTSTTGVALSTATKQAIADEVLKRAGSNVDDTAGTFSLYEAIMALLNSSMAGGTWTIKKSTGATFATRTLTTDTNAEPVIAVG